MNVSVNITPLCSLSVLFHLPCNISLMYGWYAFYLLSFKAPVVYSFKALCLFKRPVAMVSPTLPPFLNLFLLVPIVGFDCHSLPQFFFSFAFPYSNFLLSCLFINQRYLLPLFVKRIGFLLFLPPRSIFLYRSCSSHNVCVVVALFPVNIYINAHSLVSKALCVPSDKLLALFKGKLMGKCYFPFSGKPCVALLLYFLDCVPKCFPVLVFPRSILAKDNFRIANFIFHIRKCLSLFLVIQFFTTTI